MTQERVPPNDQAAERALLGCCLLDAECWAVVSASVKPNDFYADKHGSVWKAMHALTAKGAAIDTDLVRGQLSDDGQLARAGGDEYLLSLTDVIPAVKHAEDYAKRVLDLSVQRKVIQTAYEIAAEGYGGIENIANYVERAASAMAAVMTDHAGVHGITMGEAVNEEFALLEKRRTNGEKMNGHSCGFVELDDLLSGWGSGDLYFIGARPGMGKTAFVNALKLGIARSTRDKGTADQVIAYELEMTRQQLVHRLWATEAEINMRLIRGAELSDDEMKWIANENKKLERLPIHMVFNRGLRISDLCRHAKRRRRTHGRIGLITVDYAQRVDCEDGRLSQEQRMSKVAKDLKTLAGEADCPVVAISSLNRAVEQRENKRPIMSDLRDSGNLEFEADTILFLYRDEVYRPKEPENIAEPGKTEVIVGKQRSGPDGMRLLRFTKEYTRFDNWELQRREAQQGFGYEDEQR